MSEGVKDHPGPGEPGPEQRTRTEGLTGVAGTGPSQAGDLEVETRGIMSVPESQRYGRPFRLFTLWFAPQITPVTFFIGALGPSFGIGFWTSFWVLIAANLLGSIPLAVMSRWGPRTGMAQLPLSRTAFGKSVKLPAVVNWATTIGWNGFNNVFGVTALHLLLHVPLWLGVLLIMAGQATLAVIGYEAVHVFQKYMTVVLGIIFAILTIKILTGDGTTGVKNAVSGSDLTGLSVLLFVSAGSYVYTWVTYAADYSRYLPKETRGGPVFLWSYLGVALSALWMELLGLSVANEILKGGIQGASATIRHLMGGGFLGGVALIAIFIGIVGTNTLDDYTGSLSLQTAGLRLLRPLTAAISAVLSFLISLWFIYGNEDLPSKAQNFLLILSYWITAWLGVVAVDWYRRRGSVDVDALDHERGFHNGFAAMIAMVVGFVCALPVSDTTIGYNYISGHPHNTFINYVLGKFAIVDLHGADVGFLAGFVVAAVVYALLDRRIGANVRYRAPDATR